nr:UvrD-like helicase, ATP-binding domain, P-loop containing nucleoside triphosphate hydrolase [Tanacetum cinerariifolium]
MGDVIKEADLLEKVGHFKDVVVLLLWYVYFSSVPLPACMSDHLVLLWISELEATLDVGIHHRNAALHLVGFHLTLWMNIVRGKIHDKNGILLKKATWYGFGSERNVFRLVDLSPYVTDEEGIELEETENVQQDSRTNIFLAREYDGIQESGGINITWHN